jgi:hypothetical protein
MMQLPALVNLSPNGLNSVISDMTMPFGDQIDNKLHLNDQFSRNSYTVRPKSREFIQNLLRLITFHFISWVQLRRASSVTDLIYLSICISYSAIANSFRNKLLIGNDKGRIFAAQRNKLDTPYLQLNEEIILQS